MAGIRFPPGDEKALSDAFGFVDGIANGGQFRMEILKETDGVMYVDLQVLSGYSLNTLMLRMGFARFESRAIGFVNSMLEAGNEERMAKLGIWNQNRELFRNAANSSSTNGVLEKTRE